MLKIQLIFVVIFILNLHKSAAQISDKRLCVDKECKVPTSYAKTLMRYSSPDSRILSFGPNADAIIYSKSAGSREELWGGEIAGKRGYIPKSFVRETKILQKPTVLVDTEFQNNSVPSVEPQKVQQSYEIVDGTTIYLSPDAPISPSSVEAEVPATAAPDLSAPSEEEDEEDESEEEEDEGDSSIIDSILENLMGSRTDDESTVKSELKTDELPQEKSEETAFEVPTPLLAKVSETEEPLKVESNAETVIASSSEPESESKPDVEALPIVEVTTQASEYEAPPLLDIFEDVTPNPNQVFEDTSASIDTHATEDVHKLDTEAKIDEIQSVEEIPKEQEIVPEVNLRDTIQDATKVEILPPIEVVTEQPENLLKLEVASEDKTLEDATDTSTIVPETDKEENFYKPSLDQEQKREDSFFYAPSKVPEQQLQKEDSTFSVPDVVPQGDNIRTEESASYTPQIVPEEVIHNNADDSNSSEESLNIVEEESVDIVKMESLDVVKEENVDDVKIENIDVVKEESLDVVKDESLNVVKEESLDVVKDESLDGLKEDSFSTVEEERGQDVEIKEENVNIPVITDGSPSFDEISGPEYSDTCDAETCGPKEEAPSILSFFSFNTDFVLYLFTTAVSVVLFLLGYLALDKSKREGPLIAKINKLEKDLLIILKENEILQERGSPESGYETNDKVSNEVVENLRAELYDATSAKSALEEQIQSLEKELENSTEVGMELNRMLTEVLSAENGSDAIKSNIENLQRQLVEQQSTINSVDETLALTNTENHELRLELELNNKKVTDLQAELDKSLLNILKIEEEKDLQQTNLENLIIRYKQQLDESNSKLRSKDDEFSFQTKQMNDRFEQVARKLELKTKEYESLTQTVKQIKSVKNDDLFKTVLESTESRAEMQILQEENRKFQEQIGAEQELRSHWEKKAVTAVDESEQLREKYEEADKARVEIETKLDVLSSYFKEREIELQKEISKHEALWEQKQGEATSTTERAKFMQEQLQSYKAQTESLKAEILAQEVELKSQISVLEKKLHDNWVSSRQAERKLEEAKQEAAQLRNRLTLQERNLQGEKRLQSPAELNGDGPTSPASPPLMFTSRDLTKSPPLGLPPFLPPPPGVPFMPPPLHGVPPFMPPPPNMFDRRPPPLGRMSSPPLNPRYSPAFSYDRHSSSPSDSEYGTSPPPARAYSPFNNRSEFKRPPRSNGRYFKNSSGSGHSNESLEKIRQHPKV